MIGISKMKEIKISVIIPHYNSVKYLKKLCSTIPQSEDIEILVIDDKSCTDINEIKLFAQELLARNGRLIYNTTEKKGPGICRNIGIDLARGKWIVFADADDYFTPNAFKFYLSKIESAADVIYSYPTSVKIDTDEPGNRGYEYKKNIKNYIDNPTKENLFYILFRMSGPCLKMIRKSLVEEHNIRFGETMVAEDVMFSTKVGYYAKMVEICDECTYCITESPGGTLSMRSDTNELCTKVDVFVEWYKFLCEDKNKGYCPKYYTTFPGAEYVKRAIMEKHGLMILVDILKKYRKTGIKWWMTHPRKLGFIIRKRVRYGKAVKNTGSKS